MIRCLQSLERKGLISAGRQVITIIDRNGLIRMCNGAYLPSDLMSGWLRQESAKITPHSAECRSVRRAPSPAVAFASKDVIWQSTDHLNDADGPAALGICKSLLVRPDRAQGHQRTGRTRLAYHVATTHTNAALGGAGPGRHRAVVEDRAAHPRRQGRRAALGGAA